MSDIWHFPSEAPAYCFLCVFENSFDGGVHCGHYNPVKKQFCSTEGRYEINQVKKYCNLLHLLEELTNTRKALDIAKDALKLFCSEDVSYYGKSKIDARDARTALEQITALEQKDVK